LLLAFSCSNELDINGEIEERTIVYGLLDAGDSVQYIRIEKSFLQNDVSGLVLATDPSNLYYPDSSLVAIIDEWKNEIFIKRYELQKVDGDTLGLPKNEGAFASSPNILYRLCGTLDVDAEYRYLYYNSFSI